MEYTSVYLALIKKRTKRLKFILKSVIFNGKTKFFKLHFII